MTERYRNTQLKGKMKRPWLWGVGVFLFLFMILTLPDSAEATAVNRYATASAASADWVNPTYLQDAPNNANAYSLDMDNGEYGLGKTYSSTSLGTFKKARVFFRWYAAGISNDIATLDYSPDGVTWYTVATYTTDAPSSLQTEVYDAPEIMSWTAVGTTQVRIRSVVTAASDNWDCYVDALWVQVIYDAGTQYTTVDLSSAGLNLLDLDGTSTESTWTDTDNFNAGYGNSFPTENMPASGSIFICQNGADNVRFLAPNPTGTAKNFIDCTGENVNFTDGAYNKIHILAAGRYGDSSVTFTVNYSDASSTNFVRTVEAWEQDVAGSIYHHTSLTSDHRHSLTGNDAVIVRLFHIWLDIDETKTATSLNLPNDNTVRVMAVTLETPADSEFKWCYEDDVAQDDAWQNAYTYSGGSTTVDTGSGGTNAVLVDYSGNYSLEGNTSIKYKTSHVLTGWGGVLVTTDPAGDGTPPDTETERDTGIDITNYNMLEFWVTGVAGNGTEEFRVEIKDVVDKSQSKVNVTTYIGGGEITTNWKRVRIPLAAFNWEISKGQHIDVSRIRSVGFETETDHATASWTVYIDNIRFVRYGYDIFWAFEDPYEAEGDWFHTPVGSGTDAGTMTWDRSVGNYVIINNTAANVYNGSDSLKFHLKRVGTTGWSWCYSLIGTAPNAFGQEGNYTGTEWREENIAKDISACNQLEFWIKNTTGDSDTWSFFEFTDTDDNKTVKGGASWIADIRHFVRVSDSWQKVEMPLDYFDWSTNACDKTKMRYVGLVNEGTAIANEEYTFYIDSMKFNYNNWDFKWAYEDDQNNGYFAYSPVWGDGSFLTAVSGMVPTDTTNYYKGYEALKFAFNTTGTGTWGAGAISTDPQRTGHPPDSSAEDTTGKDISVFDDTLEFYIKGTASTLNSNRVCQIELKDTANALTGRVEISSYVTISAAEWKQVQIPLSAFNWGTCDKTKLWYVVFIVDEATNFPNNDTWTFYVDNLRFFNTYNLSIATLVNLTEFYAIGYFNDVRLFWKTESELDNVGFNILRSEDGKNYVKINPELIKGLGTSVIGKEYVYEDTDVVNGKIYYYLLEDVEKSGVTTKHGPVTAHPGRDFDGDGMTDDWEYYYGLPATVFDANVDSDDDGLTNLEEFQVGSNPLVIDSQDFALSQDSGVKVVESAGLRTVLELNTTTFKVTNKSADGVIYHVITLPEYTHGQTTDVGKPQIPTKGVLFGTLSKKPVAINVLESEKETFAGYNVYPVPKAVFVEDPSDPDIKRLTYEFYKDTNAYSIDAFYPSTVAEVDYSNYLQDQQVIKVIFHPVRFNPVKGSIEFYKRIRVEIIQEGAEQIADTSVTPKSALPLTEDNAYKTYITEDGIYRLTKSYLESQGISLAGVDPTKLKIYNQGSEVPIYVFGEEDDEFGASDYIEFYAQAMDTRYTGTNVYWLVLSDTTGLRMAASTQDESATTVPGSFLETVRREDTTLYWMESEGQDHWFIDAIYGSQVYDLALNLNDVANTTDEATLKIAVEGSVYSGDTFTHHLYARLNGYPISEISWQGDKEYIINAKVRQSYLNDGENTVTLEVGEDYTGYEEILVNWVEIFYYRKFIAKENALAFGNYTDGAYLYKISGFTSQDVEIYNVTDAKGVQRITQFTVLPDGNTFTVSFKDIGSKEYIVLAKDKAKSPYDVFLDEPSTLADKHNRADYIIITHPDFYDTILPFADYRSNQGLKVKVVKLDDIYDEFNYGIADVGAIKDFLKYAYYNWTGPKPAYVLLVGDATFDYRDYSGYGFTNYVPTYLVHSMTFGETGSDNWFVCFDGENDIIPDMLIGRFPVKTKDELQVMINKIKNYESASPDEEWTKKVLLVADDKEKIFEDTSEKVASYLTKGYTADKQYLGTTTNNPAVLRQNIINSINEGRLFVNYTGHGGIGIWANERLFTWNDLGYLYNQHTLPIVMTLTCANGYFVYPRYIESLGERLVNASNSGAIASFVPSGISYSTTQAYLADGFYSAFFDEKDAILGSMVARAKLKVYENVSGGDGVNVIQTYNLFGDPALSVRMKAPQIPAVAAPEVFNLDKGKVNEIFRLTEEPQTAESSGSGTVIVSAEVKEKDKGSVKKGLTKIIHEEEASTTSSPTKGALENKIAEPKGLDIADIRLEDKTVALAPSKWKILSKADSQTLKVVKPFVKIDYSAIEQNVTNINRDARQLAELRTKFDEAIKEADLQKAKVILRQISKLARKIYWRKF